MVHLTYIYTVLDVAKILSILQVPKRSAIKECPSPRRCRRSRIVARGCVHLSERKKK